MTTNDVKPISDDEQNQLSTLRRREGGKEREGQRGREGGTGCTTVGTLPHSSTASRNGMLSNVEEGGRERERARERERDSTTPQTLGYVGGMYHSWRLAPLEDRVAERDAEVKRLALRGSLHFIRRPNQFYYALTNSPPN